MTTRLFAFGCSLLAAGLLLTACGTLKRPETSTPMSTDDKASFLKRAKEPQVFGLTAYSSEEGAVFAGAFRQHKGQVSRSPFRSGSNTTTPVLAINGDKVLALIDSSAAESWITAEATIDLKLFGLIGPNPFEKQPRHVYDTIGGFAGVLPKMTIDDVHVENAVLYIRNARGPLGPLTRWEKEPYLDAVLGADFLRSFQFVRISLRGRYVVLSATDPYPTPANAIAVLPTVELQGGIAVEAVVNGEPTPMLIDIAGDFEIAMDAPESPTLRQVSLGDIVFRQTQVDSTYELGLGLQAAPRIGRQLLEKYDIVINNLGREIIFERPTP